jgi:hypothetical protein
MLGACTPGARLAWRPPLPAAGNAFTRSYEPPEAVSSVLLGPRAHSLRESFISSWSRSASTPARTRPRMLPSRTLGGRARRPRRRRGLGDTRAPASRGSVVRIADVDADRPLGDPAHVAVLRDSREQREWRRCRTAAPPAAVRLRLAVAAFRCHRERAAQCRLFPRLPTSAAHSRSRHLGGDPVRGNDRCVTMAVPRMRGTVVKRLGGAKRRTQIPNAQLQALVALPENARIGRAGPKRSRVGLGTSTDRVIICGSGQRRD